MRKYTNSLVFRDVHPVLGLPISGPTLLCPPVIQLQKLTTERLANVIRKMNKRYPFC